MISPLAFMHIAKTAGSSVNEYFESLYSTSRSLSFAEHSVYNGSSLSDLFERYEFVSGHLFFGHFFDLAPHVKKMTIIREPFAQLASHVRWINRYNRHDLSKEFAELPREVRDLVGYVGQFDLSNPKDLDHLFTNLPPYGYYLFNNLQCRYLIGDSAFMDPISLRDADFACEHLNMFDIVITLENLSGMIPRVARKCGFKAKKFYEFVNKSEEVKNIDTSCPLTRDVMRKHILADIRLYEHAVNTERSAFGRSRKAL